MRTTILPSVLSVWLLLVAAAPTAAQTDAAVCERCRPLVTRAAESKEALAKAEAELKRATDQLSALKGDQAADQAEAEVIRRLKQTPQTQSRLAALEAMIAARVPAIKALDAFTIELEVKVFEAGNSARRAAEELDRCRQQPCEPGPAPQDPPSGRPVRSDVSPPVRADVPAPVTCEDCDALRKVLQEYETKRDNARKILRDLEDSEGLAEGRHQLNQDRLKQLQAQGRGQSDEATSLQQEINAFDPAEIARQRQEQRDHSQQQQNFFNEMLEIGRKLVEERCKKACTKQTSGIFQGPLPYLGGGAVALAALLVGGGESTTLAAPVAQPAPIVPTAPVTNVNPTPAPAPAPTPAPDAIDLLMGVYLIQSCVCEFDQAGRDAVIRLCQAVQQFRLTRTGANSARIESTAPFFTSDLMIDANSRAIDGSAMGTAGSLSALLRYAGAFGPAGSPNLNLSLSYDITNTVTRYRVTAVKQ